MARVLRAVVLPGLVVLALGAPAVATPAASASARPQGSLTVSAAASLTEAFTVIGRRFEQRFPRADVTFNFGSSATLVAQIQSGAPVDVFASADLATMDRLVTSGKVVAAPTTFARNRMAIVVKPGNPKRVQALEDLEDVGIVALCGATVPCGAYAANVLGRAGVTIPDSRVTRGLDAKATLAAVATGDADAALVYVTDAAAAEKQRAVQSVEIPEEQNTVAIYPAAPIAGNSNSALAKAFVAFLTSPTGQRALNRFGFLGP